MYVQQVLTFVEQMELQTESFLCYVCLTTRYVDQGGGKRKGSFAIYQRHADIFDFRLEKKQEKRKCVLEIYSLRCGRLICS
jgi:hypothetical protein